MGEWGLILVAWLTLVGVGVIGAADNEKQINYPTEYTQAYEEKID